MRLCCGSFAKAIQKCKKPKRTNVVVVDLLLGLVTDNKEINDKDGEPVSQLQRTNSFGYFRCPL